MRTFIGILIGLFIIGILLYFFVYRKKGGEDRFCTTPDGKPGQIDSSGVCVEEPRDASDPIVVALPIPVGTPMYLKLDAPAVEGYAPTETLVWNAPVLNQYYLIGKIERQWYGNQPIGTYLGTSGNAYKIRVGQVSDFTVAPFTLGVGWGGIKTLIVKGTSSRDVFFDKNYLTKTSY